MSSEYPLISVIIPMYNVSKYIGKCVESLKNQIYTNIEVISVNDGSKDDSFDVCKESIEGDTRFVLIDKENGGVASARNAGLNAMHGDFVAFIDSDDYVPINFIQKLYEVLKKDCSQLSICDIKYISKEKESLVCQMFTGPIDDMVDGIIIGSYCGSLCNKLFVSEIIRFNNIKFADNLDYSEDRLFLLKYLKIIYSFSFTNDTFYNYISRANSAVNNRTLKSYTDEKRYIDEEAKLFGNDINHRNAINIAKAFYWRKIMLLDRSDLKSLETAFPEIHYSYFLLLKAYRWKLNVLLFIRTYIQPLYGIIVEHYKFEI